MKPRDALRPCPPSAGSCSPRRGPGWGLEKRPRPEPAPPSLPCMFSGICPCSPCDRASPRASVSTLGSMTRRPRAGMGGRCRSGGPAPGHGQHTFNSGGKKKGRPLTHPLSSARPRGAAGRDLGAPSGPAPRADEEVGATRRGRTPRSRRPGAALLGSARRGHSCPGHGSSSRRAPGGRRLLLPPLPDGRAPPSSSAALSSRSAGSRSPSPAALASRSPRLSPRSASPPLPRLRLPPSRSLSLARSCEVPTSLSCASTPRARLGAALSSPRATALEGTELG